MNHTPSSERSRGPRGTTGYRYIRAWGEMMGSREPYIRNQIARARAEGAPPTAIYRTQAGPGPPKTPRPTRHHSPGPLPVRAPEVAELTVYLRTLIAVDEHLRDVHGLSEVTVPGPGVCAAGVRHRPPRPRHREDHRRRPVRTWEAGVRIVEHRDGCFARRPMVTWHVDGFRLELFTTVSTTGDERPAVVYRFWDLSADAGRARPVFEVADWHPSILHAVDGTESVRGLLGFLCLRPGDVEADYFASYTPRQLTWRDARAEDLTWWASQSDEAGEVALVLDYDAIALPPRRARYAVVPHDGLAPGGNIPEPPATHGGTAQVVTSLRAAERSFRRWLVDSGNDQVRGPGRVWAEIYRADDWDGTSYGDPLWRLTCSGPRGGITREAH